MPLADWDEYADLWFQIAVHSCHITQARHQLGLLIEGWTRAGQPRIRDWSAPLRHLDLTAGSLLVPSGWTARPTANRDAR